MSESVRELQEKVWAIRELRDSLTQFAKRLDFLEHEIGVKDFRDLYHKDKRTVMKGKITKYANQLENNLAQLKELEEEE